MAKVAGVVFFSLILPVCILSVSVCLSLSACLSLSSREREKETDRQTDRQTDRVRFCEIIDMNALKAVVGVRPVPEAVVGVGGLLQIDGPLVAVQTLPGGALVDV